MASRQSHWRRRCPINVHEIQLMALTVNTFFLLRQNGPLAFTVQEYGRKIPVEIRIGDRHSCTCQQYRSTKDLCTHISWILLRKFKISIHDTLSYQLGMTSQEIHEYFQKKDEILNTRIKRSHHFEPKLTNGVASKVLPKQIKPTDVCPICLEDFQNLNKTVTHCLYGCGNGSHVQCIWMVAKFSKEEAEKSGKLIDSKDMLKCPLCRGDFNKYADVKLLYVNAKKKQAAATLKKLSPLSSHPNVSCSYCKTSPIVGNVYRCARCYQVILCALCLSSREYKQYHGDHGHVVKCETDGCWKPVKSTSRNTDSQNITNRKPLPNKHDSFESLPTFKVTRSFLLRRLLCAFCSHFFHTNEIIFGIRCGHYVHDKCLMEQQSIPNKNEQPMMTCPLDGIAIRPTTYRKQSGVYLSKMMMMDSSGQNLGKFEDGIEYQQQQLQQRPQQQQEPEKLQQYHRYHRGQPRPTYGSLEVRVNRMNLLERPSKDWHYPNRNNNHNSNNNKCKPISDYAPLFPSSNAAATDDDEQPLKIPLRTGIPEENRIYRKILTGKRGNNKRRRRNKKSDRNTTDKFSRSSSSSGSAQSTRALGSQVNPLMTLLMAPSSNSARAPEKPDDNVVNIDEEESNTVIDNNNNNRISSTSKRRHTFPLNIKSIELQSDSLPRPQPTTYQSPTDLVEATDDN